MPRLSAGRRVCSRTILPSIRTASRASLGYCRPGSPPQASSPQMSPAVRAVLLRLGCASTTRTPVSGGRARPCQLRSPDRQEGPMNDDPGTHDQDRAGSPADEPAQPLPEVTAPPMGTVGAGGAGPGDGPGDRAGGPPG